MGHPPETGIIPAKFWIIEEGRRRTTEGGGVGAMLHTLIDVDQFTRLSNQYVVCMIYSSYCTYTSVYTRSILVERHDTLYYTNLLKKKKEGISGRHY